MKKSFLYRAKISKATESNCILWLDTCRKLYNLALEQRINIYKQYGKSITGYDQSKQLVGLKKSFTEFKLINAQCLQGVVERLDKAYQNFFRRVKKGEKPGFPRFKSKDRYDSFTLKQNGWKIDGRYLIVKNIGKFKLFLSRPIEGKIKTVTIRRSRTNKWFVAFSCDNVPKRDFAATTKEVGIDVGIKSFCVDSDATQIQNPKFMKKALKKLRLKQRLLSRKKRGSKRRYKAKYTVAQCHEKIVNQRKDFLHKTANYYIKHYDKIYIEKLNIKNMMRNHYLARSIADSSWNKFFEFLSYKAEEAGRAVIKVNPRGTSQICSQCGERVPKALSVRVHHCPFCNLSLDRDLNAALNILAVGQTAQSLSAQQSVWLRIPCIYPWGVSKEAKTIQIGRDIK